MKRLQLSHNFYLHEFTRSQAAARHGIDMTVDADSEVFNNLKRLAETALQPARDDLGPIFISSGYRPRHLNTAIGGSRTSAHIYGCAADISVSGHDTLAVAQWFADSGIEFDQVIHEFGEWVHVGLAIDSRPPRQQLLTAVRMPGKTVYVSGIHSIEDAREMVR